MTMSELNQSLVDTALQAVVRAALAARDAPTLEATKPALNAVWFAVHRATETVTSAERETRREALAHIEGTAA